MPYSMVEDVAICGMAAAVPKQRVLIDSYKERFGSKDVEKFKKYTGIYEVRRALTEQTASDLGFVAAENLFCKVGISRNNIGILIFISQSPDYLKPATACVLQHRLGLSDDCIAFDVNHGCSGFVYGNQIIRSLMTTTECEYGLLIVADTASKHADQMDKSMAMLNGDAGSAILYHKGEKEKSITLLETNGRGYRSLITPGGGFRDPAPEECYFNDKEGNRHSKLCSYMDGMEIFNFSITEVPRAVKAYLQHIGKTVAEFDHVLMHQANMMIMQQLARRINIPSEKMAVAIPRYGNTNGVTIPLTICDVFGGKTLGKLNALAIGFGIGLSLGVTSFCIDTDTVLPVIETDDYYREGRF